MGYEPHLVRKSSVRRNSAPRKPRLQDTFEWGECIPEDYVPPTVSAEAPEPPADLLEEDTPSPIRKRCVACKKWKLRSDQFYVDRRRSDGLSSYCRPCQRTKSLKRYVKRSWPCNFLHSGRKKYVPCSDAMARRPHDEIPGYKRGYEPSSNPIWDRRVRRMLTALSDGPLTAAELQAVLRITKKWQPSYTVNVLIAAQEQEMVAYDGVKWHLHRPCDPMPPTVEKPKVAASSPEDDLYPDQLPL